MSKLYLEYIKRKKEDNSKYYLFKSGLFYIFIENDAEYISKITPLCLTNLNKEIVKCGFPSNSLDKYMTIFKNLKLDVVMIDNICSQKNNNVSDKIIRKIKNIDVDKLTPVKALNLINEFKEMLSYE